MRLRTALIFIIVILLARAGEAQEILTLERALDEAQAHNPSLAAARLAAKAAAEKTVVERSRLFPRLSVSDSWQRGNLPVFAFGSLLSARRFGAANFTLDALNNPEPVGLFRGAVSVEQLWFDGGKTRASVDAAGSARTMAMAGAEEMTLSLAFRVTQQYGRVLTAESGQRAGEAAVAAASEDVVHAEHRRDAGTATEADVLSLLVHLAAMRERVIERSSEAAIARAELNHLRGAPVDAAFAVQEPALLASAVSRDWPALVSEAEAERPELKRTTAAVARAEADRRQARAAWWPEFATQAAYEVDGINSFGRASSWLVGGVVRWTLSTGGAEAAGLRAAGVAEAQARAEHEDAQAAVQVELMTALRRAESAEARETVARSSVEQARESQRIIRDRYEAGMTSVQNVLAAATTVLNAENQRVTALVDRIDANAALARALGRRQ